jgi:hypothetical protein
MDDGSDVFSVAVSDVGFMFEGPRVFMIDLGFSFR